MAIMMGKYDTGAVGKRKKPDLSMLQIINMSMGFLEFRWHSGYKMEMRAVFWGI